MTESVERMLDNVLKECRRIGGAQDPIEKIEKEKVGATVYSINKYRSVMVRDGVQLVEERRVEEPEVAVAALRPYIPDDGVEHLVVLNLDAQHNIIGINTVSSGTIDAAMADPGLIFDLVWRGGAKAFILGHNHPSGDPTLSREDRALVKELSDLGHRLRRPMLDFIVLGDGTNRFYSAKKAGNYDLK
jgi:DNA repair protein RadC